MNLQKELNEIHDIITENRIFLSMIFLVIVIGIICLSISVYCIVQNTCNPIVLNHLLEAGIVYLLLVVVFILIPYLLRITLNCIYKKINQPISISPV
jgi:hypothetical protein